MRQVKVVASDKRELLERDVNTALEDIGAAFVDIKFAQCNYGFSALIVYEER